MLKKMIPLILTVLLALSIAGCTNTPAESTPTGTPDSSAPAGSGTAGSAGEAVAEVFCFAERCARKLFDA